MGQPPHPKKIGTFPLEPTDTKLINFHKLSLCLYISFQQSRVCFECCMSLQFIAFDPALRMAMRLQNKCKNRRVRREQI